MWPVWAKSLKMHKSMIETNMEKENNKNQKVPYSCDTNAKLVILLVIIGNLNSEIIIILTLSMKR